MTMAGPHWSMIRRVANSLVLVVIYYVNYKKRSTLISHALTGTFERVWDSSLIFYGSYV